MNYKNLDTNFETYILKLKNFKQIESNELKLFLKDLKEVSLDTYSDTFDILKKRKKGIDSNLFEKIKIMKSQITELNKILESLNFANENEDIQDALGVLFPLEGNIESILKE